MTDSWSNLDQNIKDRNEALGSLSSIAILNKNKNKREKNVMK